MSRTETDKSGFITIARIVKPQGRRGEVAAELHTDFPERFDERRKLQLLRPGGERTSAELEAHWFHKGRVILKFRGVDSISEAERINGSEVQIAGAERTELQPGSAYISDLAGCEVTAAGRRLGTISAVQFGAGEAPLLAVAGESGELLIPFAEAYIRELDVARKRLVMELPEGMLELQKPLSAQEKQEQKRRT